MADVKLYSYFRSSASYRVRIALAYKGVPYKYVPVHLVKDGGEQHSEKYKELNPNAEVPTLVHGERALSQSMAIFNYLDEAFDGPKLFPKDPYSKAKVIQIAEAINSGIQPVQNLKVLQKIQAQFNLSDEDKFAWAAHWNHRGFTGLEKLVATTAGHHAFGDEVSAADMFIVPQIYNARRFKVDMNEFPTLSKIEKNSLVLESFQLADPANQPDTPGNL